MRRDNGTTIAAKTVIPGNDFQRLMVESGGATKVKCSEFADAIIKHMGSGSTHTEHKPVPQMQRA